MGSEPNEDGELRGAQITSTAACSPGKSMWVVLSCGSLSAKGQECLLLGWLSSESKCVMRQSGKSKFLEVGLETDCVGQFSFAISKHLVLGTL